MNESTAVAMELDLDGIHVNLSPEEEITADTLDELSNGKGDD